MVRSAQERIKHALSQKSTFKGALKAECVLSGVIVPVFQKDGIDHLVFIRRSDKLSRHAGQMAFPGGVKETSDPSVLHTALRETYEEVGIAESDMEVLGELDPVMTSLNFMITPFVAAIPHPYTYCASADEVSEIVEIPVTTLLDGAHFHIEKREYNSRLIDSYVYDYNGRTIWGATARIVRQLLTLAYEKGN